ncbi:MAG: phospholipase [Opitutus sp.]|nr:phospholipase [Opitutus sp.]
MKITPPHILVTLLTLCAAPFILAADTQSVASFEKTITKKVGYQYLLSLPTGYDAASDKKWPVILFLHGSGERGSDVWKVAIHGPPKLIRGPIATPPPAPEPSTKAPPAPETVEARALREQSAAFLKANFIVVSPQCPAGKSWDDDGVLALLDEITVNHKTDPTRHYLTGLSMGGFGTWSVAMKFPERFAAIVPICGGGNPTDVRRSSREKKVPLTSLGVWVFHGAKDPTVALAESETMVAALKKAGVTDLQLTVYPEAKHDSWTETYNNPELYAWLLKHQR